MADNEKQEDKTQFDATKAFNDLDASGMRLIQWVAHTSLQKGRVLGRMEVDGKSAKEIAEKLHTEEELVQKVLDEDPFGVIAQ